MNLTAFIIINICSSLIGVCIAFWIKDKYTLNQRMNVKKHKGGYQPRAGQVSSGYPMPKCKKPPSKK